MPKILSFDIGTSAKNLMAFAFTDNGKDFETGDYNFSKSEPKIDNTKKNYYDLYKWLKSIIDLYKPTDIVIPVTTARRSTYISHNRVNGIILFIAHRKKIPVHEVRDNTCRKNVLGKGNATKDDVVEFFKQENDHRADACMFGYYYFNIDLQE